MLLTFTTYQRVLIAITYLIPKWLKNPLLHTPRDFMFQYAFYIWVVTKPITGIICWVVLDKTKLTFEFKSLPFHIKVYMSQKLVVSPNVIVQSQ